jgi:hypothetical protein
MSALGCSRHHLASTRYTALFYADTGWNQYLDLPHADKQAPETGFQ